MSHGATRSRLLLAVLSSGQLWACTLTSDPFEPRVAGSPLTADESKVESTPPPPIEMMSVEDENMCSSSTELPGCELRLSPSGGECSSDLDCESLACMSGTCAVASCSDGRRNGDEDGIDCGGPCVECDDCATAGRCRAPTCDDAVRNQGEPDVDCAGPCSQRCGSGEGCASDEDCGPDLFCPEATRRCTAVSCSDEARNGDEILADCGGGECPGCPVGTPCNAGADCLELVCGADDTCAAPTCDDGVKNQDETATDCGGSCDPCPAREACAVAADCQSGVCAPGGCNPDLELCCQQPSCDDDVRNGTEPSIDCGNFACGLCVNGRPCNANAVCASGSCQAQVCRVHPCEDNVRNGTESGIDCGGNDQRCDRCATGGPCQNNADCASNTCAGGICISCNDGIRNGTETDVDCGGTCALCQGLACGANADCASGECQDGTCCGGELEDCTRCARRLATGIDCGSNGAGPEDDCNGFLQCLADNLEDCQTRSASECSDDPDDVCNHQDFGTFTGPGITLADAILLDAGCQL